MEIILWHVRLQSQLMPISMFTGTRLQQLNWKIVSWRCLFIVNRLLIRINDTLNLNSHLWEVCHLFNPYHFCFITKVINKEKNIFLIQNMLPELNLERNCIENSPIKKGSSIYWWDRFYFNKIFKLLYCLKSKQIIYTGTKLLILFPK